MLAVSARRLCPPALLALLLTAAAAAAQYPDTPPSYVLILGNSFSRGQRDMLEGLLEAYGLDVGVKVRARQGFTLGRHDQHSSTSKTLSSRPWDIVLLQEQSDGIDEDRYDDARALDARIVAIGATTMFFMTWRDAGEPPAAYDDLRGEPGGTVGYVPIAFELDAPLAPVGWAFRTAVEQESAPPLWGHDGHHASKEGRYLAACVLFATILRTSPVGLDYWPSALDPARAAELQQLAADTVLDDPDAWNLPPP